MGLPILQEIWDGIRWIIDFFLNKVPKPITVIIFLLFVIFFGSMISWMLHLSGIHCTSDQEPVKVDAIDIVSNIKIFWLVSTGSLQGDIVSIDEAHPYTKYIYLRDSLDVCAYYMRNVSGEFEMCDRNQTDCYYYYRSADCYDCDSFDAGFVYSPNTLLNWVWGGEMCLDNAVTLTGQSWYERNIHCEPMCEIPPHYAWDYTNGRFVCIDLDICGDNATMDNPNYELDYKLDMAGAELIYTTESEYDYRRFVGITCNSNLNPRLAFYRIDIFDYKIWLFLIVIYVLVTILNMVKK